MTFNIGNITKGVGEAKTGCVNSVTGIFIGLFLFSLAFLPAWCSVRGVREYSEEIAGISLITADEAKGKSGLVKIHGDVDPGDVDYFTQYIECMDENIDVFWYRYLLREYGETTDSEGEKSGHWTTLDDIEYIADSFMIGDIEVDPRDATIKLDDYETVQDKGGEVVGDLWLLEEYLPVDDVRYFTVVGEIIGDRIDGGDPFFVSDMRDQELVTTLAGEESTLRWIFTIMSIVMFFIAFNLIIGPLLFILKYVPVIGKGVRFAIGIISLVLAVILVLIIKFVIAYWWLLILLLAGLVVLIVVLASKRETKTTGHVEKKVIAEEKTSGKKKKPSFCPKCGDPVDPDEKFCNKCGHKLVE